MKCSFIIPARNEEKIISDCINSIKAQIKEGDEIIVVDNNSTDKTGLVSKKAGAKVFKEAKKGISHARNKGAQMSKNEILCFIDADDIMSKKWRLNLEKSFKDKEVEAVVGVNIFIHKYLARTIWYNIYTVIAYSFVWLNSNLAGKTFLSGNNLAIKKRTFNNLGGFEPVIGEDYWLTKKFWKQKKHKAKLNFSMVLYHSSRGFDATGYFRTIHFWIKNTLAKSSQDSYNYQSKEVPAKKSQT